MNVLLFYLWSTYETCFIYGLHMKLSWPISISAILQLSGISSGCLQTLIRMWKSIGGKSSRLKTYISYSGYWVQKFHHFSPLVMSTVSYPLDHRIMLVGTDLHGQLVQPHAQTGPIKADCSGPCAGKF